MRTAPGWLAFVVLVIVSTAAARGADDRDPDWSVAVAGSLILPREVTGPTGEPVPFVGASGLSWMGGDRFVAVLDNGRRLVTFRLRLAPDGRPVEVSRCQAVELDERHDYEDVVWLPDERSAAGRVLVCEEDGPGVHAFDLATGRKRSSLPVPAVFGRRRANRGFESLALDPDGRHVWTANEEPLDGDDADPSDGMATTVRLVRLPIDGRETAGGATQLAYEVDPPHTFTRLGPGGAMSGLTAIVAVEPARWLSLERSAAPGIPPFSAKIYAVDPRSGDDIAGIERGLAERRPRPVSKRLLWHGQIGVNLEGLCLGPTLGPRTDPAARGSRSLLAISDNGGLGTPGQIVGFRLATSP